MLEVLAINKLNGHHQRFLCFPEEANSNLERNYVARSICSSSKHSNVHYKELSINAVEAHPKQC